MVLNVSDDWMMRPMSQSSRANELQILVNDSKQRLYPIFNKKYTKNELSRLIESVFESGEWLLV